MSKKVVVKLRIYKGKEVLLKADAKTPANENELITLTYNDLQWKRHLANLCKMGVCKVEVESVYEGENQIETPQSIVDEVAAVLKPQTEVLSPEQEAIRELQKENAILSAKLEAFMNANPSGVNAVQPTPTPTLEVVETDQNDLEVKDAVVVDNATDNAKTESLEDLQQRYVEKFAKDLPKPYKNNVAWIKTQLES